MSDYLDSTIIQPVGAMAPPTLSTSPTPTVAISSTPTPTVTPTQSPILVVANMKQLFRRYNDGTLVLRDEMYDGVAGYQHVQDIPSATWIVYHNLDTTYFNQNIFIDEKLVKADVVIVDDNTINVLFGEPVSGMVNLIRLYTTIIPTPTATSSMTVTPTVTPTPSVTTTVTPTPT
jgi:hypothetical protein